MKEIMAVIRQNKINQTKEALVQFGFSAFTARKVYGRGKGLVDPNALEGAAQGCIDAIAQLGQHPRFYPKRLLTLVIPDDMVQKAVQTIIEANKTGKPGDGKIFIMPVSEAYRIRTGEINDDAIDEVSSK